MILDLWKGRWVVDEVDHSDGGEGLGCLYRSEARRLLNKTGRVVRLHNIREVLTCTKVGNPNCTK